MKQLRRNRTETRQSMNADASSDNLHPFLNLKVLFLSLQWKQRDYRNYKFIHKMHKLFRINIWETKVRKAQILSVSRRHNLNKTRIMHIRPKLNLNTLFLRSKATNFHLIQFKAPLLSAKMSNQKCLNKNTSLERLKRNENQTNNAPIRVFLFVQTSALFWHQESAGRLLRRPIIHLAFIQRPLRCHILDISLIATT